MRTWKWMIMLAVVSGLCLAEWGMPQASRAECAGVSGRSCIRMAGTNAFLANTVQGISIYNLDSPTTPVEIGCLTSKGCIVDMDFHAGYAFVVDDAEGLLIVDVRNPERCILLGNYDRYEGQFQSFTVHGDYALAAVSGQGLRIFDLSDAPRLREVAQMDQPAQVQGLRIFNDHAYIANFNGGLHVYDLQNPLQPREVATIEVPGRPRNLGVSGDRVYMTTSDSSLHLFDVSEPAAPVLAGSVEVGNSPVTAIYGDRAYVADLAKGLVVMDISDPANVSEIGRMDLGGIALGICIRDGHAFLSMAETNHIQVVDLQLVEGEKRAARE